MPVRESIQSLRHPLLKQIRRALDHGEPTPDGYTVIEGRHLLEEALRGPTVVETLLAPAEWELPVHRARRIDVPETVLRQVASTESSPGVIALVRWPSWTLADLLAPPALVVVLDGVQDPGNAGTILRSAEAFGATGVVFRRGAVSPRNPKLLR
ncbi:MAG: RNA methyltransferase, partial [Acidobacteria bacterium]|nr:RNA methyltransferase [Acidobacteriota bacterium]